MQNSDINRDQHAFSEAGGPGFLLYIYFIINKLWNEEHRLEADFGRAQKS